MPTTAPSRLSLRRAPIWFAVVVIFGVGWFLGRWSSRHPSEEAPSESATLTPSENEALLADPPARPPVPQPFVPSVAPTQLPSENGVVNELRRLRQELAELKAQVAEQHTPEIPLEEGQREKRRNNMARAVPEDFAPQILMETIDEVMKEAEIAYEVVALDCARPPCIFFGEFEFTEPLMMDTWVRFRERMYDRGRPLYSTQRVVSNTMAIFAMAPTLDQYDSDQLWGRMNPILDQLEAEFRAR